MCQFFSWYDGLMLLKTWTRSRRAGARVAQRGAFEGRTLEDFALWLRQRAGTLTSAFHMCDLNKNGKVRRRNDHPERLPGIYVYVCYCLELRICGQLTEATPGRAQTCQIRF